MGYDVSDYFDIDPVFGTLADFDAMVDRAHALGLKVIIDQVLSHSSDRHLLLPGEPPVALTADTPTGARLGRLEA
ncbi:MAG: alpha-amylase family glycosyl hydrolase [Paracoccaceae bacterium]